MAVGGNEHRILFAQVDVHPRHRRTEFVVAGSKDRIADGAGEYFRRNLSVEVVRYGRYTGEVRSIFSGKLIAAVVRNDFDAVGRFIDRKRHRLLRKVFEGFQKNPSGHGNAAFFFGLHLQLSNHTRLEIGGCDRQGAFVQLEQEILKYWNNWIGSYHPVNIGELLKQIHGVYDEFHSWLVVIG